MPSNRFQAPSCKTNNKFPNPLAVEGQSELKTPVTIKSKPVVHNVPKRYTRAMVICLSPTQKRSICLAHQQHKQSVRHFVLQRPNTSRTQPSVTLTPALLIHAMREKHRSIVLDLELLIGPRHDAANRLLSNLFCCIESTNRLWILSLFVTYTYIDI